jgi:hypothetical protein
MVGHLQPLSAGYPVANHFRYELAPTLTRSLGVGVDELRSLLDSEQGYSASSNGVLMEVVSNQGRWRGLFGQLWDL